MLLEGSPDIQHMQDATHSYTVLVLCTGNSARSIMAEVIFNHYGKPWFRAFSAGSHPVGRVNPFALQQIEPLGDNPDSYRSKSWLEYTGENAPELDFVITVCDNAAGETCPNFMGTPQHIHWGLPDPAAVVDDEDAKYNAFASCFNTLRTRIETLVQQPINELDKNELTTLMKNLAGSKLANG